MPERLLMDWDLSKVIQYKPKHLKIPPIPAKIVVDFSDEDEKVVASDPLLHQRIVDACQPILRNAASYIESWILTEDEKIDREFKYPSDRAARALVVQNSIVPDHIKKALDAAKGPAAQAVDPVIRSLQGEAKQYKKYKHQVTVKLVLGAAGLGASVLGVVTAVPSGGASLGLAIVGLWRSIVDGAKALLGAMKEAETVGHRVTKKLIAMNEKCRGMTRRTQGSQQVATSVVNALFQTELSNIATLKTDCTLWKNKLTGVRTKSHKLSTDLNQLLLKTDPRREDKPSARKFEKMRKQIIELLERIPTLHERAEDGFKAQESAAVVLRELSRRSPGWTKAFDKWFSVAVNAGLALAGAHDGWSKINDAGLADWIDTAGSTITDSASLVDEAKSEGSGRWQV